MEQITSTTGEVSLVIQALHRFQNQGTLTQLVSRKLIRRRDPGETGTGSMRFAVNQTNTTASVKRGHFYEEK